MYISITVKKVNDDTAFARKVAVDCGYEFGFGHYTDATGKERIDYTSFCLRGVKKDSHDVEKDFEIEMSPSEISRFVEFVIENRLVDFKAHASYRDH